MEKEQFDDAMIEARQLVYMTELNSQVLQQLSSSYNNILNNNLNDNLTTLTILEALLAVFSSCHWFLWNECSIAVLQMIPMPGFISRSLALYSGRSCHESCAGLLINDKKR